LVNNVVNQRPNLWKPNVSRRARAVRNTYDIDTHRKLTLEVLN